MLASTLLFTYGYANEQRAKEPTRGILAPDPPRLLLRLAPGPHTRPALLPHDFAAKAPQPL